MFDIEPNSYEAYEAEQARQERLRRREQTEWERGEEYADNQGKA